MQTVKTADAVKTARTLTARRDHDLTNFRQTPHPNVRQAFCKACERYVWLETNGGDTAIYGPAVREHCIVERRPAPTPLTLADVTDSLQGKTLHSLCETYSDGKTPLRVRVTSVKRWKLQPSKFRIRVKYGLKHHWEITTEDQLKWWSTDHPDSTAYPQSSITLAALEAL